MSRIVSHPLLGCLLFLGFLAGCASAGHAEDSAALRAHAVVSDGHPMRVWEKSAADPERVMLLVHGRTWSTRPDFDLQVEGESKSLMDGLVQRDFVVYGIDLRGYGETPRDATGWMTPDRAAADVARVLAWIRQRHPDLPVPALFGWSYGAMVSQLVAQRTPENLSAIILFGYPVRPGVAVTPPDLGGLPPARPTTAAAAAEDFIVPGSISDRAIEAFVAAALAADPIRADWRNLEQWRALSAAAVTLPALLLEGELDPLALDDVHAELFDNLATSDKAWVVFPDSDHVAFMETPRSYFLDVIETFLRHR